MALCSSSCSSPPTLVTCEAGDYQVGGLFALGILSGIAADTALKGVFDTLDPSWQPIALKHTLIVALVAVYGRLAWRHLQLWTGAIVLGVLLVLTVSGERSGVVAAGIVLVGQTAIALLLTLVGIALGRQGERSGLLGVTVAGGLGMMLLMFAYYGSYELAIPVGRSTVMMLCASDSNSVIS